MRRILSRVLGLAVVVSLSVVPTAKAAQVDPVLFTANFPEAVSDVRVAAVPQLELVPEGQAAYDGEVDATIAGLGTSDITVTVPPDDIPAGYMDKSGVVDFRVSGTGETGEWTTNVSAQAVTVVGAVGSAWVDPSEVVPTSERSREPRTPRRGFATVARTEVEDNGIIVTGYHPRPAGAQYCRYDAWPEEYNFWATVATTYPLGSSTAAISTSSSSSTTYGFAWAPAGNGWGGATGGRSISTTSAWGWDPLLNGSSRSYRLQVHYQRFHLYCSNYPGGPETFIGSELRPMYETGGTQFNYDISRPGWNSHCVPITQGGWWRERSDGNAYSFGAGVKAAGILGFDLFTQKQYSSGHKIRYQIVGRSKRLCGNDAHPSLAAKIIERS